IMQKGVLLEAGLADKLTASASREGREESSTKGGSPTVEELEKAAFIYSLYNLIAGRKREPVEGSYTNYLFNQGVDKICKKIGEEAAEVIIGAKNASREEMVYEIGDLIYHLLVLLNLYEIPLQDIFTELEQRNK
ncbi:MAG: phosphoribosyl-ATP diphosphatase, partial [Halanaerobiales bacterium]